MWLNRIVSFFTGYLEILVRGAQLEKLINLLTSSGLYLWDIKRLGPDTIHAKLRSHGFLMIRPILKRSGATVKIRRKRGLPFLQRKMLERRFFLFGAALFIGLLLYLSTLTLFIKIDGFSGTEQKELIKTLNKAGLKPGRLRKDLLREKRRIERDAIMQTPEAVWLGINFKGVVAEVKAIRRKTPPPPGQGCDLVAGQDGLITRIVVIRGRPVVKEGDIVAKGDLLISGKLWHSNPLTGETIIQNVPASGIVEARVWHDVEVTQPKKIWRVVYLKNRYTVYSIRWGNRYWRIFRTGSPPGSKQVWWRARKQIIRGRNPNGVVELIKDVWQDVRWQKLVLTGAEIKKEARREARTKVKYLAGLTNGKPMETWIDEGDFLKLILTFEVNQDIAMLAPTERRIDDRSDSGTKN